MAYVYQPYPKHLHKPDGSYKVVQNEAEKDAAMGKGWNDRSVPKVKAEPEPEPPSLPEIEPEPEEEEPAKPRRGRPKKKG